MVAFRRGVAGVGLVLVMATGCSSLPRGQASAVQEAGATAGREALPVAGPILRLGEVCRSNGTVGIPVRDFMYFVPLISPEPVDCSVSAGSTQSVRLQSVERSQDGRSFTLRCRFALVGAGVLQNDYDHTAMVSRSAEFLRGGGRLTEILGYIRVEGEGICTLEASGESVAGVPVVQKATLAFAGSGGPSPVRIGLEYIAGAPEAWKAEPQAVAYVASLSFARTPPPTRMNVSLASLRDPQAGDTLTEQLKGALKGAIANLLIPPVDIEASGNQALLDFAAALFSGAPTFAFPLAPNLRSLTVSSESPPVGCRLAADGPCSVASPMPAAPLPRPPGG
jgi:hypothetical protein